jgi:type II secretory pathway pseudopilin PulG
VKNRRLQFKRRIAFTLVEVLATLAVFAIMILFLGTLTTVVGAVSSGAAQNAENSSNARAILDLLSEELEAGVSRPDLNQTNWITVSDAGSTLAFYSRNQGSAITTGAPPPTLYRPLSYIEYTWSQTGTNAYLARGDQAVLWTSAPAGVIPLGYPAATTAAPAANNVLDGVLAFQVSFLQKDGSFTAAYSPTGTLAAAVSVALVDSGTLHLLVNSGKRQSLSHLLTGASVGSTVTTTSSGSITSPKLDWENALNSSSTLSGYPQQVRTGLRFFERTVDLPKPIL